MAGVIVREHTSVPGEEGAALAFVILLMLAVLVLAHGALVASLAELAGSRAAVRDLELRGAARWSIATTLATAVEPWMDSVGALDNRTNDLGPLGRTEVAGTLTRLASESWLVEGTARNDRGAEARAARLAWVLDPLTRVTALEGVVSVGPTATVTIGGAIDATSPTDVREPMPEWGCDPWVAALEGEPVSQIAALPDSVVAPALGLLDVPTLLAWAPVSVSGSGTPAPADSFGACVEDAPWGWGDPDRPSGPCGGHLPMRSATGDLEVSGGVGQGVLVVEGDLTLRDGARYYGMLVVGGVLRLEGSSTFEGMALAGEGLVTAPGSTLVGSACWAVRALDARRDVLARLVPVMVEGAIGPL